MFTAFLDWWGHVGLQYTTAGQLFERALLRCITSRIYKKISQLHKNNILLPSQKGMVMLTSAYMKDHLQI